jgi:hypothetical protein
MTQGISANFAVRRDELHRELDMVQWRILMTAAMSLRIPWEARDFLTS